MGNTTSNATDVSIEQEVKSVLESNEEVSNEMLASLMWDSPPESLLAALNEDDFGLSDFVWLDKKQKNENDNGHERTETPNTDGDEERAKRVAEIRRRIEEEVARRRMEMALQEEEAEKRKAKAESALALHCAHCNAPITKAVNIIAATAANGKVYCKAHTNMLLKCRAYEQKSKQRTPRNGKRAH